MLDNQMGPNAVWLAEWLCEAMSLQPGQRVLDLGCGRAMTSIFLAKEFGVQVSAADLWMGPDHNWTRAVESGVADRVCPLRAEAHALPFAKGYFDAVFWEEECWSFRTAASWRQLWGRSSRVRDVRVDTQSDGWRHWRDFERALELSGKNRFPSDAEALERDAGQTIGFVRAVATRTEAPCENLYESGLGVRFGVDTE